MPPLDVRPLTPTGRELRAFVGFRETVYRGIPQWVAPLRVQQKAQIRSSPIRPIGEFQLFMAWRGDRPAAPLSVHRNFAWDEHYGSEFLADSRNTNHDGTSPSAPLERLTKPM